MNSKTNPDFATPKLNFLSQEQVIKVHESSVKILGETGVKVESKAAQQILSKSNAVKIENDIVFFHREIVEHSIKVAPETIDIFDKNGNKAFQLGNKTESFFGIGVTNTNFQEIETNEVNPFKRKHQQICTRLGDLLPNYDIISTIGIPSDVLASKMDLYNALDMYANTSKPLVLLISEGENINKVFELLSSLHGDISSKPFMIPYFNLITPLILNEATCDKMIASINNNLPVIFSNYSMSGATTPISDGGTLALLNAELLAGLVFSQLIKEGSQIILGSLPAAFNMSSMGSYYTPSSYLLNTACAEMMEYYAIPHCGTSGSGKGWGSDLITTSEFWMNHLTSCLGKSEMVPFIGGNFDSMAFSPTNAVLSDYIIGEAKKFAKGFTLDDISKNIEEIKTIGHGGNFLTSNLTLESILGYDFSGKIWPSLNFDSWNDLGRPEAKKYLVDYTKEIFDRAEILARENQDIIRKGEELINKI